MKLAVAVAAIAALSGCTTGETRIGAPQLFGYPSARVAGLAAPAAPQPPSPAAPDDPAVQGAASAEPPGAAPYDMTKDPYVTAVLLPSVEADPTLRDRNERAGRKIVLPPPAMLEVIDLSDNRSAYDTADF